MKKIGSGHPSPFFNPFGVIFGIIGFFVKLVGFFLMLVTLVTGALMSIALFFGLKKLTHKSKPINRQQPKVQKADPETIDVEAEVETI